MTEPKLWSVPDKLTGNIWMFGRVGAGKSCKLMTICQGFHSKGYKVWDLFGGKRNEGPFWCFPNTDDRLWKLVEQETYQLENPGPKEYKVNLLYPMFSEYLPKRLPYSIDGRVKSKVFTIPLKDIDEQMISTIIGPLSNVAKTLWQDINGRMIDSSGMSELEAIIDFKLSNRKNTSLYQLFLSPLMKNRLMSSKKGKLNIDLIEEAKDTETVSVLCLDYVPEAYRWFVISYFLKQITNLIMGDEIHKKNITLFREASAFMKVVDEDDNKSVTTKSFRNLVNDCARYARSGMFIAADTQSSAECKGMISGSDDIMGICELPDPKSVEETCLPLKRVGRMSREQMNYVSFGIKIEQILLLERGKKAFLLKRINPPRCAYWKPELGNFESYWKRMYDSYVPVKDFFDVLEADSDLDSSRVKALMLDYVPEVASGKKVAKNAPNEPMIMPNDTVISSVSDLAEAIKDIAPKKEQSNQEIKENQSSETEKNIPIKRREIIFQRHNETSTSQLL